MTGGAAALLVGAFATIAVAAVYSWARLRVQVAEDERASLAELAAKRADELDRQGVAMATLEGQHAAELQAWERRYRELAEKHGDTDAMADSAVDRLRGGLFGSDASGSRR